VGLVARCEGSLAILETPLMPRWLVPLVALAVLSAPCILRADEVIFKNGDHLTGKIESLDAGKMTFTSPVAGKLTIEMKDVRTFASDGPIALKLNDGTVTHQKVSAAGDGQVALAPGGALQPQNVAISNIKYINFKEEWTGSLTVGGSLARGNTDTDNLNISAAAVRRGEKDRVTVGAGFLYSRQRDPSTGNKNETENNWYIEGKYDYFLTKKVYAYVNARVERDLIADISLRFTPGVGLGYQWFDQPDFHFNTEGGISWLYRDDRNDGTDESVAGRLAYHVDKKVYHDKLTLFHDLEYYPGLDRIDNYYFITDAGVRAAITDKMFTEFKAEYRYDSAPAPGKEHSDQRFLLGVGWNF
jgi:putative salt-induced outer membrane protein YdiY